MEIEYMMKPEAILRMKEQFKAETAAYSAYKMLTEMLDDEYLIEALSEIMYDEYLHAKFLRSYMLEMGVYDPTQHVECEKAYMKMIESN
jgi:rubrerythrin